MNDDELIRDFIRVDRSDGMIRILVGSVGRDVQAPVTRWLVGAILPSVSSDADIEDAIEDVLQSPDHFALCPECGERVPLGWMDMGVCQTCSARDSGVVH
jgi:hypothetical protein